MNISGSGCFFPGAGLSLSKFWYLSGVHYLELRTYANYRFGVPVKVRGLSYYGGGESTRGKVTPGNYTVLGTALQYNLTKDWGVSCDFVYEHHNRAHFSGHGKKVKDPSSELFNMAPSLQYDYTNNLGIISGVWFSLKGRNAVQFLDGIISFEVYY